MNFALRPYDFLFDMIDTRRTEVCFLLPEALMITFDD